MLVVDRLQSTVRQEQQEVGVPAQVVPVLASEAGATAIKDNHRIRIYLPGNSDSPPRILSMDHQGKEVVVDKELGLRREDLALNPKAGSVKVKEEMLPARSMELQVRAEVLARASLAAVTRTDVPNPLMVHPTVKVKIEEMVLDQEDLPEVAALDQEDLLVAVVLDQEDQLEGIVLDPVVQDSASGPRVLMVLHHLVSFNLRGVVVVVSVLGVSHPVKDLEVKDSLILLMVHRMPVGRVPVLRMDLAAVLKVDLAGDLQVEEAAAHHRHHTVLLVLVVVLVVEALVEAVVENLMEANLT